MNRNTKIILGILIAAMTLCSCLGIEIYILFRSAGPVFEQSVSMSDDAEQIARIGAKIAEYDLPPGYEGSVGSSFFWFDMVVFAPADRSGRPNLGLTRFSNKMGATREQMERQMEASINFQSQRDLGAESVEFVERTIRDQTVILTVREGMNEDGQEMRHISGVFEGQYGMVLIFIAGRTETWDEEVVDMFLDSIR
jgi:hypothetical protein